MPGVMRDRAPGKPEKMGRESIFGILVRMPTPPPAEALRIERHVSLEALAAAAGPWNALADAAALQPFATWPWVRAHVRHRLDPGETFTCHLAWQGETLVGVLPLLRQGRALRVLADFHTHDGEPLLAADVAPTVLPALLAHVVATEPAFTRLDLGGMRAESPAPAALAAAPGPAFLADDLTGREIHVAGLWADRRATLSPNFRRNLKKAHARALREGAAWLGIDGSVGAPALVDAFVDLEGGGWKGREGNPIRATPRSVAFYRDFAEGLAAAGWLRFHRLEIAGRLAAAHLGVRLGRRLVLLKIAYDVLGREGRRGRLRHRHALARQLAHGPLRVPRRALPPASVRGPGLRRPALVAPGEGTRPPSPRRPAAALHGPPASRLTPLLAEDLCVGRRGRMSNSMDAGSLAWARAPPPVPARIAC